MIWYTAYGSNLKADRFLTYLRGGRAAGAHRVHEGARDRTDPRGDAPCWIPHRLYFAGCSRMWGGGGVAFIDPQPGSGFTPARRYLITDEQFQDVLAQESGRGVGAEIELGALDPGTSLIVGEHGYDQLVVVGCDLDHPMVTFTSPLAPDQLQRRPPSDAYLATVLEGLMECHGCPETTAREMLEVAIGERPAPP